MEPIGTLKQAVLRSRFRKYLSRGFGAAPAPDRIIVVDYPYAPKPRYGFGKPPHPELLRIIGRGREQYRERLRRLNEEAELARAIAAQQEASPAAPDFMNFYFTGLDAVALCGLLRLHRPATYFEIGSGNSTKFVRRAIDEYRLPARILSCDPTPRAEVNAICDEIVRKPVEDVDLAIFDRLAAGDMLFIDNSHRVFQNSDVATVFLDILPRLKPGVIVHLHDILLPYDYPPEWATRFYSEQYLLACCLLANPARFNILLPAAFVSHDKSLAETMAPLWATPEMRRVHEHATTLMHGALGYSFWFETAAS